MHQESSKLAGKIVKIKQTVKHFQVENFGGSEFIVEDWWDRVSGRSWMDCNGNPACMVYAMRTGSVAQPVPTDDNVVYGKVGSFGHLVHMSELDI